MTVPTFSVSVRLRRTTVEEVHVQVPITDAVVSGGRVDGAKVFAEAIRIGQASEHSWRRESGPVVEVHPIQTPPPGV